MGFSEIYIHSVTLTRFTLVFLLVAMSQAQRRAPHGWLRLLRALT